MNNISVLDAALKYAGMGLTPIPLSGKIPILKDWQKTRGVTEDQCRLWFVAGRNVGLVTGAGTGSGGSHLVVIDFDGQAAYDAFVERFPALAETYTVATGSGHGYHCYYYATTLPATTEVKDTELGNIELKAEGRQVVAPPSIHPDTGKVYTPHKRVGIRRLDDMVDVVLWIQTFIPQQSWQPPAVTAPHTETLNPAVLAALRSHFESVSHKVHGDWINCSCPNARAHRHGDRVYSFGYNTTSGWGHCWRCGTITTKALCEYTGIDYRSMGGLFERAAGNSVMSKAGLERAPDAAPPPAADILQAFGQSRSAALLNYHLRLFPDTIPSVPPISFPLASLYDLRGYARVLTAGKLVGVVGASGTGKTSMLETMVERFGEMGVHGIVWSPEWSPAEMAERAVQRVGALTMERLYLYEMHKYAQAHNIKSSGQPLTSEEITTASRAIESLRGGKRGDVFYLAQNDLTSAGFNELLPHLIQALYKETERHYRYMMLDYAQLMHASENQDISMYTMLQRFKIACARVGLYAIVATQTTKADSRQRANGASLLDAASARYVNDDPFNLFITLNVEYENAPLGIEPGTTGVLNVTKNSTGVTGKVRVYADLARLRWVDQKHPNQDMSIYERRHDDE